MSSPAPSRPFSLRTSLLLLLALVFLVAAVVVVVATSRAMRQQALYEAEERACLLLDRNLATHTYFTGQPKPAVFDLIRDLPAPPAFDPAWMSSTYALREINRHFQAINGSAYYYKECAVGARYPGNEADAYERAFIEATNVDPNLVARSGIRTLDGKPYFVYLRKSERMDEGCLRCHGSPKRAPAGLVERYGDQQGFGRQVGELDDPGAVGDPRWGPLAPPP